MDHTTVYIPEMGPIHVADRSQFQNNIHELHRCVVYHPGPANQPKI
jgi:hypothetical protein